MLKGEMALNAWQRGRGYARKLIQIHLPNICVGFAWSKVTASFLGK